jgi:nicotinamidase-related amidase
MKVYRKNVAGICVDIQSKLFPHINNYEQVEKNILKLIEGIRVFKLPIVTTEQYSKGLGSTIPSIQEALKEDYQPIEKTAFSCCRSHDVMKFLTDFNKTEVILFGIESHVCVLQTALDLLEIGGIPIIVEDCVASRNPNDKAVAIERLRQSGALITTYESLLFEICEVSGTEEFKAISKIVK